MIEERNTGQAVGTAKPMAVGDGDSVDDEPGRVSRGGEGSAHHRRAREYAGVNISHEFRLACEQNRSTSQREGEPRARLIIVQSRGR